MAEKGIGYGNYLLAERVRSKTTNEIWTVIEVTPNTIVLDRGYGRISHDDADREFERLPESA